MNDHVSAAQELLDSYDAFLAGKKMSPAQLEQFKSVCSAISFGAAAYQEGHGGQAGHAMGRSFLLALIDPTHPDLDYLRASPESGEVARMAKADLQVLTGEQS